MSISSLMKRISGRLGGTLCALTLSAAIAASTLLAASAYAARAAPLTADQAQAVQALTNYFNQFNNLQGEFVQVGPRGHISRGMFYLSKPGRLRFEYEPPNPFLVVADGQYVIVANKKNEKTDFYPLSQTPLQLVLAPRVDLLEEANVVDVQQRDDLVAVTLEDKSAFVPGQLVLVYDIQKEELQQWIIVDGDGNRTTISLTELTSEIAPDPKLFEYKVPRKIHTGEGR